MTMTNIINKDKFNIQQFVMDKISPLTRSRRRSGWYDGGRGYFTMTFAQQRQAPGGDHEGLSTPQSVFFFFQRWPEAPGNLATF